MYLKFAVVNKCNEITDVVGMSEHLKFPGGDAEVRGLCHVVVHL